MSTGEAYFGVTQPRQSADRFGKNLFVLSKYCFGADNALQPKSKQTNEQSGLTTWLFLNLSSIGQFLRSLTRNYSRDTYPSPTIVCLGVRLNTLILKRFILLRLIGHRPHMHVH